MNIEEIINNLKKYINFSEKECNFPSVWDWNWHMELANDVETLLTAYEKEKEKNKKLKWKPIKDYDRKKYDWVLVKYFDGDYECVPIVAEKREDKWISRDDVEIPFEVKYFFDMQEIL